MKFFKKLKATLGPTGYWEGKFEKTDERVGIPGAEFEKAVVEDFNAPGAGPAMRITIRGKSWIVEKE